MMKKWMKAAALALALIWLAGLPGGNAAATFDFGSELTGTEPAQDAAEPAEEAGQTAEPEEDAAGTPYGEETDAQEEAEEAKEIAGTEISVFGFSGELEEMAPKFEEILNSASKWSKKKAPQTLAEFPALPEDYQRIFDWMAGRTASFAETDGVYEVTVEAPDFAFLVIDSQATAYFKDMSTLQMTRKAGNVFAADKPEGKAYQAADFWRIDLRTPAVPAEKAEDGVTWDSGAWFSIASQGLIGPAGGTDEICFEVHRNTTEMNQSIVWFIRGGQLTVDIYYGNGNEVCRELTYDVKTGKLVSSEEW